MPNHRRARQRNSPPDHPLQKPPTKPLHAPKTPTPKLHPPTKCLLALLFPIKNQKSKIKNPRRIPPLHHGLRPLAKNGQNLPPADPPRTPRPIPPPPPKQVRPF